ncbi:LysR substrate-binding domain-containing protein [Altererythrobacter sp. MF3-039]|uniref:LysR substrate-binding domain-containing protein n=1 Tax=Altererythrobacter sp. MF3-039 TaxID=3252901 RepID=UPI00390C7ED9
MPTADLDPSCLRAFVTVADCGGFTAASQRLGRGQSAVSLQVKRLEDQLGVQLLDRRTRQVGLTPAGERLIDRARQLLAMHRELAASAALPEIAGAVRLGVPEDFASTHLPGLLAEFVRAHPRISLEVTCELTLPILERFDAGELDLVLFKRRPGAGEGETVLHEDLAWVTAKDAMIPNPEEQVSLVCAPRPCVLRDLATKLLDQQGRGWRIAFSSGSLAGNLAALRAGLGIAPLPLEMVPPDLVVLDPAILPALPDIETSMLEAASLSPAAQLLRDSIREARQQNLLLPTR